MAERLKMAEGTQGPGQEGPKILIADKSGTVVGERSLWRPPEASGAGAPPETPPPPVDIGPEPPEEPELTADERLLQVRQRLLKEEAERVQSGGAGESMSARDPDMTDEEWEERERQMRDLAARVQSGAPAPEREARDPSMSDEEWVEFQRQRKQQEEVRREEIQRVIREREEARDWDIEYEASPERGSQIVEEIIKWEAIRMTGKDQYGKEASVDWNKLNKAYLDLEIHNEAFRLRGVIIYGAEGEKKQDRINAIEPVKRENLEIAGQVITPINELISVYESGVYLNDPDRFASHAALYFKEAKSTGLLRELDKVLSGIYTKEVRDAIRQGVDSSDVIKGSRIRGVEGIQEKIQLALDSWERLCRARMRANPDIRLLLTTDPQTGAFIMDPRTERVRGVGDLYARLALERLTIAIDTRDYEGLNQVDYIRDALGEIQEYELGQVEEEDEEENTYWTIEWGRYPKIHAQTVQQYRIAAETYLGRLQSVSTSPNELLQGSREFVEAIIRSDGFEKVEKESPGFVIDLTDQIRARVGTFGADHEFELYAPKEAKQYLDYTNEDGAGPRRYLQLAKAYEAMVMATVRELDRNPLWDILFSFHGSRGQIARNFAAQKNKEGQGLYDLAFDALVDQMIGVQIINLDKNLDNVTKKLSDRQFSKMFDGLYRYGHVPEGRKIGDAHTHAYEEFQRLTPDQQKARRRELSSEQWNSIELGRIQLAVEELKAEVRAGRITLERGETVISRLDGRDRVRYQRAKDRAEKFVEVGMQIYGAWGEKSKRGGGIFTIQRKNTAGVLTHQDLIPVHLAEKWVQFHETMAKIKYANSSAKARTAAVAIVRAEAITRLKTSGYDAKPIDIEFELEDGKLRLYKRKEKDESGREIEINEVKVLNRNKSLKLKQPKENPDANEKDINDDGLLRNTAGDTIPNEVEVDFYTATHHPFADFDPNAYWGYQDEHRAVLLQPDTFAIARAVRDGLVRWEDADEISVHLLKLDPTLRRVRALIGQGFVEREGKLVMAAVGESTRSRLRIRTDLYEAFWPELGTPTTDIGVYYGFQDFGGFLKMTQHLRARIAENPERFARRGRRLLPGLHNSMEALSDYWGMGVWGATGAINAMDNPLQRIGGTFALAKYSAFVELANRQYESLIEGRDQEGNLKEALLLKLTNESDTVLEEFYDNIPQDWKNAKQQQEFCVALRKSLNRLEVYVRLLSIESSIKNAQGMIFIEDLDILNDSGELDERLETAFDNLPKVTGGKELKPKDLANLLAGGEKITESNRAAYNQVFNKGTEVDPGIDEGTISFDTGLGRHIAKEFVLRFLKLLQDTQFRGGARIYKTERYFYSHLQDEIIFYDPTIPGEPGKAGFTIIDWLISKMIPT